MLLSKRKYAWSIHIWEMLHPEFGLAGFLIYLLWEYQTQPNKVYYLGESSVFAQCDISALLIKRYPINRSKTAVSFTHM